MARRRSRKDKNSKAALLPLILGSAVLVGGIGYALFASSDIRTLGTPQDFSIAEYRNDGSRMAVPGNQYVLEGRVENIETIAENRIVSISLKNNPKERLPLFVPKEKKLNVNLSRKDTFLFQVECRTGRDASGNEVKGILVVKNADSTK